jgi:hypothetical protein
MEKSEKNPIGVPPERISAAILQLEVKGELPAFVIDIVSVR